jgi:hypothetical protein
MENRGLLIDFTENHLIEFVEDQGHLAGAVG